MKWIINLAFVSFIARRRALQLETRAAGWKKRLRRTTKET